MVALKARRGGPVLPLAALLLMLGGAGLGCGAEPTETTDAEPAPAFDLESLAGPRVSLASLRGRPAIIDFWATWCAPCVRQVPVLNALLDKRGDDVAVIGISVDAEGADAVAPFAEEHEIAYTILLGDEGLAQDFGARGFPTLFVLDAEGAIREAHVGVASLDELEEALARLGS